MRRRAVQSFIISVAIAFTLVAPAAAQAPEPYVDPPWADDCVVHEYGEGEAPEPGSLGDDPLCVRYAKEDITVDNGGALAFLAGEPGRVLAAVPACAYWQQDRWSVQLSQGTQALVSWAGSYWFDRGTGQAAAILRDFQIAGQPAGADQVADLIEPLSAEWAETLRAYSGGPEGGAGGWVTFEGADPSCAATAEPPAEEPADDDQGEDEQPEGDVDEDEQAAPVGTASPSDLTLPTTGGASLAGLTLLAGVGGLALRAVLRDRSGGGGS